MRVFQTAANLSCVALGCVPGLDRLGRLSLGRLTGLFGKLERLQPGFVFAPQDAYGNRDPLPRGLALGQPLLESVQPSPCLDQRLASRFTLCQRSLCLVSFLLDGSRRRMHRLDGSLRLVPFLRQPLQVRRGLCSRRLELVAKFASFGLNLGKPRLEFILGGAALLRGSQRGLRLFQIRPE